MTEVREQVFIAKDGSGKIARIVFGHRAGAPPVRTYGDQEIYHVESVYLFDPRGEGKTDG